MALTTDIPIKLVTLKPTPGKNYRGHFEADSDALSGRIAAAPDKAAALKTVLGRLAMVGFAAEFADVEMNHLTTEQAKARGAEDLVGFHAICDANNIGQEHRVQFLETARSAAENWVKSAAAKQCIEKFAQILIERQELTGDEIANYAKKPTS